MIYLGIGSNLGDRKENLKKVVEFLSHNNIKVSRISPIYETAAFLPVTAKVEWNRPYLNAVLEVEKSEISPFDMLKIIKKIEKEMSSPHIEKWAPRIIDIDIIFFNDENIDTEELKIPHPEFHKRAFVLDPLSHLCPHYIPEGFNQNILEMAHSNLEHQPLTMGVMNISPDSFSSENSLSLAEFEDILNLWEKEGVNIIDIGAEATNANVHSITDTNELARLNDFFSIIKNRKKDIFSPLLSIDTYHYQTALKAIDSDFDILNDVSGLRDERLFEIANSFKNIVLMHSLSIPASRDVIIDENLDIIEVVNLWLRDKLELCNKKNINQNKIIFDLGAGFGKNANQSLRLMQNIERVNTFGIRNLLGHSRKSFMNVFTSEGYKDRDIETLAISLNAKNFDIVRVHNPIIHKRALIAKMHTINQFTNL